jgi:hypothetical protein
MGFPPIIGAGSAVSGRSSTSGAIRVSHDNPWFLEAAFRIENQKKTKMPSSLSRRKMIDRAAVLVGCLIWANRKSVILLGALRVVNQIADLSFQPYKIEIGGVKPEKLENGVEISRIH